MRRIPSPRPAAPPPGKRLAPAARRRLLAALRALGDATRLEVFRLVASGREPVCVCRVVDRFRVSQPTISHHLRILREAGLVTVSRKGRWSHYAPAPEGLAALRRELDRLARARAAAGKGAGR